ncbi:MAG: lipopolysaccharide core biosynthesis protein [candidate division TA06 bacterium ADurb.Bin131]|uniref:Lipopolysaccharide core biosynthesis protein n=1 Tax=candidate division TA06 bacterium ADurb.Bin131 TaxID=1852827 RepID=A0A1V6CDE7_UNCT6|nr:MAG: lipopolysaccharide core biosynthesis protein [candidate division TA06 bacterium ADurb.Bin131]
MRIKNNGNVEYKKILIVGTLEPEANFLLIPAIRLIREKNKNSKIDIIAGSGAEKILADIGWFEKIIPYKKTPILKNIHSIRSQRYNLVISFYPSLIPFFTRARKRIVFFRRIMFADHFFTHESVNILRMIEPIFGKSQDTGLYFPINETDKERVKEFCKINNITGSTTLIALHAGSANNRWKAENYSIVCDSIIEEYNAKILFFGAQKDSFIKEVIDFMKHPDNIFDMSSISHIKTIAAFLSRANLAITRDGIFLYLACAMKTPVISIFGAGNPYRYGPIGVRYIIVHTDMDCFPCNNKQRCKKNCVCIDSISPQQVIEAARLILDEGRQLFLFE